MGNLRSKYTDEEWEELEEFIYNDNKAKEQVIKDMQKSNELYWEIQDDLFKPDENIEEDE